MKGVVFCFILTLFQMIAYTNMLEMFSETRRLISKNKILSIFVITAICTFWACALESYFYIKIITTIILYLLISIIYVDAKLIIKSALSMIFFNLAICIEYILGVIVLNVDSMIPGKTQGNLDILQIKIVTIEEIILIIITLLCLKNKGRLREIKSILQIKDWLVIFIIMIFSAMILVVAAKESGIYQTNFYASLIGIAIMFMNVAIIYLFVQSTKRQKSILVNEAILNRVQNEITLYKSISDNLDKQRKRTHEFDNHLVAIRSLAAAGNVKGLQDYIHNIQSKIPKMQQESDTKHTIINAIINAKSGEMQSKNILFVTKYNDLSSITISDDDLVVLLSNLLNNAIEASEKANEKIIKMKFVIEDNQIILSVKNTFAEPPVEDAGKFITTKTFEPIEHGIGLKNIKSVIKKYNGAYVIDYDKEMFSVSMIIPY